mmetsp:Transcript_42074/g.71168  ORF Transcript_42074/g.71168 Transcript_42074/m.71168 type:complete len:95 (+) Transcript_42074:484-768(+)
MYCRRAHLAPQKMGSQAIETLQQSPTSRRGSGAESTEDTLQWCPCRGSDSLPTNHSIPSEPSPPHVMPSCMWWADQVDAGFTQWQARVAPSAAQ